MGMISHHYLCVLEYGEYTYIEGKEKVIVRLGAARKRVRIIVKIDSVNINTYLLFIVSTSPVDFVFRMPPRNLLHDKTNNSHKSALLSPT